MKTFLGIDFGTTQTSVARIGEKTKYEPEIVEIDGKKSVYTVLRLDAAGNVALFGDEALDKIHEATKDTFYNFKTEIGSGETYRSSSGKEYSPEDLALLFLSHLAQKIAKGYFNALSLEKVADLSCVIGCPAAWDKDRRRVLVNLAQEAGFPNVICCDEPVGVIYYCSYRGDLSLTSPLNVLIYDFGGGTTDVAVEEVSPDDDGVIRKIPMILSISERPELGDLGGRNFDEALKDYFIGQMGASEEFFDLKDLRALEMSSKRLKENLSNKVNDGKNSAEEEFYLSSKKGFHKLALSKDDFEQVCKPLIDRLKEPIDSALNRQPSLNAESIGCVILAGGSSRLYYVKKGIKDLFPNSEIVVSANPVEVVAKGLALYGRFSALGPNVVPARPKDAQDKEAKAAGLRRRTEERADSENVDSPLRKRRWRPWQVFERDKKTAGRGQEAKKNDDISAELSRRKTAEQCIKAARNGDMYAVASLRKMSEEAGAMYEKNDRKTAYMWYYIASSYGSAPAKDKLDALRGKGWLNGAGWRKMLTFSWLSKKDSESAEREASEIMNTQ
ncbi:MAG: Hsp70 family protein [Synergistaceae bacterium]|jgi:actin-like ATPase involved in cell morphogenesis|nr:Hsp70 family protein [Synergistaceae bacterium]